MPLSNIYYIYVYIFRIRPILYYSLCIDLFKHIRLYIPMCTSTFSRIHYIIYARAKRFVKMSHIVHFIDSSPCPYTCIYACMRARVCVQGDGSCVCMCIGMLQEGGAHSQRQPQNILGVHGPATRNFRYGRLLLLG